MRFEQFKINRKQQPATSVKAGLMIFATLLALFMAFNAAAQQVNVSVNIIPPYSPYYSDYTGANASKVLIILQNLTNRQQQVKLVGTLQGDNGVLIQTYSNYVPLQPITLNPNQVMQLNGTALKSVFDINALSVKGFDKGKLAITSRLPEGNYSLCIQAWDYKTNAKLSLTSPIGCTQFNITYPEPPVLVNPKTGDAVAVTTPQAIVFNWINPGTVPIGTQYTIQMAQMPDVATDPNQVLNAAALPILSQVVSSTSYLYSVLNFGLQPGKKYAWRVIAKDPTGTYPFKNQGVSAAASFIYGDNKAVVALANITNTTSNLNFASPSCDPNGTPTVLVGDKLNMNVGWLWREQLLSEQYFGIDSLRGDTLLLNHYTQTATNAGMVTIANYRLDFFHIASANKLANGFTKLSFKQAAPLQNFDLPWAKALSLGFVAGERYNVKVTALDPSGKEIDEVTSCDWLLKSVDDNPTPKLNITGRLAYGFTKGLYHDANKASITLQLTGNKYAKAIDGSRNYVSTTTDVHGNFAVKLTQDVADTGKKYVFVKINNPYYRQPDTNLMVRVPKINYGAVGAIVKILQDTLKTGDINTLVYSNQLTVRLKEGFPDSLGSKQVDEMFGGGGNYSPDVFIDAATVDTMARIPDGIKVTLYRKSKADDIPAYEGDGEKLRTNNTRGAKLNNLKVDNYIMIGEATTQGSATGKSQVVFKNLICNIEQGDQYYLKAQLPDSVIQKQQLYAPETAYRFTPPNPNVQAYNNNITYNIISQKPPTAHVRGRVMYQWPSTPGVLHPYANKTVYVNEMAQIYYKGQKQTDMCQLASSSYVKTNNGRGGNNASAKWDPKGILNLVQMGQATTDANGYFDIEILVPTKMGPVDGVSIATLGDPCKPPAKPIVDKDTKAENKQIIPGLGPVEGGNPYEQKEFGNQQMELGNNALGGMGGLNNLNQLLNGFGKTGALGSQLNIGADINKGGIAVGPSAQEEEEEDNAPRLNNYLDRYFSLVVASVPNIVGIDTNVVTSADHFVVQPFKTIDLGTILTEVAEIIDYPVNITPTNGDMSLLTGAKLVVYRSPSAVKYDFMPDGEGSLKHPMAPLLSPVYAPDPNNKPVEWVIDKVIDVPSDGKMNLGKLRLYRPYYGTGFEQYRFSITPNASNAGGYFQMIEPFLGYAINSMPVSGSKADIQVQPIASRISGRVLNSITAKAVAEAQVTIKVGVVQTTVSTDSTGYFELINGQTNGFSWKDQGKISITAAKAGYTHVGFIPPGQLIMANGKNYYYNQLSLKPGSVVVIRSIDAVSKIDKLGFAITADSSLVDNNNFDYAYHFPIPTGTKQTVTVYANDQAYFEETVTIDGSNLKPDPIQLITRHHRIQLHLYNPSFSLLITDFQVYINNKLYSPVYSQHSNKDGYISFDFENVSVNNFIVKIVPNPKMNYVPEQFNIKNVESKLPVNYDVLINPGAILAGTVRLDGHTVPHARVYLDYKFDSVPDLAAGNATANATSSSVETYTDKNGYYYMMGIPVSGSYMVKMHATLDTTFMVNGATEDVNLVATPGTGNTQFHDFNLSKVAGGIKVTNIYGYPLTIESVQQLDKLKYQVTGLLDLSKNNSPFKMIGDDAKVRVRNVTVTTSNLSVWTPVAKSVSLDAVNSFKMKYLNQYNVKLESPNSIFGFITPLTITPTGTGGAVMAHVSVTDNSFNYPSTYMSFMDTLTNKYNPFYLVDPNQPRTPVGTPTISAIYNTDAQNPTYHLASAKGDSLQFSFIGFNNSKVDPANSYISTTDKQFHLDVTFKGNVPHSDQGFVKVHIKDLKLDGQSITPFTGTDPISVDLQSWKLHVNKWTIDPKEGGITAEENSAYVSTGIVDIPANTFNLRHDNFVLSNFNVQNVSLGGGLLNLSGMTEENAHLVWDAACGSDHRGHWRFSAINADGGNVASIPLPAVTNKIDAATVNLNYFQLISFNNENIIGLSPQQTSIPIYTNSKFRFMPASVTSMPGSFDITGTATFGIPRVGDQAVSLIYTKANNAFDVNVGNFQPIKFEGKGYVQFTSNKDATFKPNGFITSIDGTVVEPDKFNAIPCTLTFGQKVGSNPGSPGNDMGTVTLKRGYKLRLDGPGETGANDMSIVIDEAATNKMAVDKTNDWNNLTFAGAVSDPKSNGPGTGDALQTDSTRLTVTVLGDLDVSSKQISVSKINTPLGDLQLTYDFPSKELRGALHMNKVKFGDYDFTGDMQTVMGPSGLIILGAGQLDTGDLFIKGFGILNIGVLFADKTLDDGQITTVTQYSKAKNSFCWLDANKQDFKGFFVTGGLQILDEHKSVNFVIASGYFNANLGVEATIGANFHAGNYMAMLGAHGDINAGLSSIVGTSISGGLSAHITADATYTAGGFAINGDAGVTIKYKVSQYIPFVGTESIGGQKGAKINFGVGGGQKSHFDFSMVDDGNAVKCTSNGNVE